MTNNGVRYEKIVFNIDTILKTLTLIKFWLAANVSDWLY